MELLHIFDCSVSAVQCLLRVVVVVVVVVGEEFKIEAYRVSTTYWIIPYPTYLCIDISYCKIFCTILLHIDVVFIDIFCILGSLSISLTFGHLIFGHFSLLSLSSLLSSFFFRLGKRRKKWGSLEKGLKPIKHPKKLIKWRDILKTTTICYKTVSVDFGNVLIY